MKQDKPQKPSITIVYTGDGKGKTSASLGLMVRALGADWSVGFVQFIKHWMVNEHHFIHKIQDIYPKLKFIKGGKGFYNAGDLSAKDVSNQQHEQAAVDTYDKTLNMAQSGDYQLVICDEINNAVNDGLLSIDQLHHLISNRHPSTNLCLTGRNFPEKLLKEVDIATNMTKLKHHYDDGFLASSGIDFLDESGGL